MKMKMLLLVVVVIAVVCLSVLWVNHKNNQLMLSVMVESSLSELVHQYYQHPDPAQAAQLFIKIDQLGLLNNDDAQAPLYASYSQIIAVTPREFLLSIGRTSDLQPLELFPQYTCKPGLCQIPREVA